MAKLRKADEPVVADAVSTIILVLRPETEALAEKLPRALLGVDCPDRVLDEVRKRVMNEIGWALFHGITVPLLSPDGHGESG